MKKTLRTIGLIMMVPILSLQVACKGDDPKPQPKDPTGTEMLGEITIDKENIAYGEPFTASCPVSSEYQLKNQQITWYIGQFDTRKSTLENGVSVMSTPGELCGNIPLTVVITGLTSQNKEYEEKAVKEIRIEPTEIRNCNWGDTKEKCQEALKFYGETTGFDNYTEKEGLFYFAEDFKMEFCDIAPNGNTIHNQSIYKAVSVTRYEFANNLLERVVYNGINFGGNPSKLKVNNVLYIFTGDFKKDAQDVYGCKNFVPNYEVKEGQTLSAEELAQAEAFKKGEKLTNETLLAQAIQDQKVRLYYVGTYAQNELTLVADYMQGSVNQFVLQMYFEPNK